MKTIIPKSGEGSLELLSRCGGFYDCHRDSGGKRIGPLVGYAGRDQSGRQYVGEVYVNFAKAEQHTPVLRHIAARLDAVLTSANDGMFEVLERSTGFCGAPEGGKALAFQLASINDQKYLYPEKKIVAVATEKSREVSELVFDRHEPEKGDVLWVVEDVCNNFSTTAKLVASIESFGASVCGILCFLNRSLEFDFVFSPRPGLVLPIIAVVRKAIPQYRQDDVEVENDVVQGNVVWKPKNEWKRLASAMAQVKQF